MTKKIFLCAICNISSGSCQEDCKFCTQSIKHGAKIDRFYKKELNTILHEAKQAKQNGALGFCLVTAGKGLDDKKIDFVCSIAKEIKKELDFNLIACNGTATKEQLIELKKAGIDSYNHNLETSKEFYNNICTTHSWEERFETCLNVKEAGLSLCSGGIFGLGESIEDRVSLVNSLKELKPTSVPINFFHPNSSLPLKNETLSPKEATSIIRLFRQELPEVMLMVAGGRDIVFKDNQKQIFEENINAIVIGNYLTTQGNTPAKDLEMLNSFGIEVATNCHE
ncbi:MAG: biotin synthase [Campylobacterales bacterium]|nr:biotin synthase [Campylobacterales bacterium]